MTDPNLRDLIKRQSREAELLIFSYTGSLLATHRKKKKWKKETYFTSLPSPVWFSSEYRANGRNTFIEYVPPHSAKTKNAAMQTKGLWWAFSCHGLGGWAKESRTDWGGDVPDGQMLAKGEQQRKSPPIQASMPTWGHAIDGIYCTPTVTYSQINHWMRTSY